MPGGRPMLRSRQSTVGSGPGHISSVSTTLDDVMNSSAAAFALVALLATIHSGSCLNCYQCTSASNPHCKDPFGSPKDIVSIDCNANNNVNSFYTTNLGFLSTFLPPPHTANAPRYCLKLILGGSSSDTVVRTCAEGASDNVNKTCVEFEKNTQSTLGQITTAVGRTTLKHCSVCNTESCNGAAGTAASITLAVSAAALTYLAYH